MCRRLGSGENVVKNEGADLASFLNDDILIRVGGGACAGTPGCTWTNAHQSGRSMPLSDRRSQSHCEKQFEREQHKQQRGSQHSQSRVFCSSLKVSFLCCC